MTTLDTISQALLDLLRGQLPEPLPAVDADQNEELKRLTDATNSLANKFREAYDFLVTLSQGGLDVDPPPRNFLITPFKQLHSSLRHLTWQTQQVARGDLNQRVDFLGDFSLAFNSMIESLREKRLIEQALARSHEALTEANTRIMDSIHYASSIQQAILPPSEALEPYIQDYFVLWEPRDIIGGDMYWFDGNENEYTIAVMDCTGHGVPGAVMTMIAVTTLNRVVNRLEHRDPALILERTNRLVKSTLTRRADRALYDDGLDIGICTVDRRSRTMVFAGARISLFLAEGSAVREIRPDRQSIGYRTSNPDHRFTNHRFELRDPGTFYMITDGVSDQVGGPKRLPFGKRRFQEFVRENCRKPLSEQKEILRDVFKHYKGEELQRDDVTVLGVRASGGEEA